MTECKQLVSSLVIGAALLALASPASALSTYNAGGGNDTIIIGRATHLGDFGMWACRRTSGVSTWTQLDGDGIMGDDWQIDADGGADQIIVISATINNPGFGCASDTGTNWAVPSYGGFDLNSFGDTGSDVVGTGVLANASGDGWSDIDRVTCSGFSSTCLGYTGDDFVVGSNSTGQNLFGEDDNDCVDDGGNGSTTFDCGPGTDTYVFTGSGSVPASCTDNGGMPEMDGQC